MEALEMTDLVKLDSKTRGDGLVEVRMEITKAGAGGRQSSNYPIFTSRWILHLHLHLFTLHHFLDACGSRLAITNFRAWAYLVCD